MRKESGFSICGTTARKSSSRDWSRWVCKKLLTYPMEAEIDQMVTCQ